MPGTFTFDRRYHPICELGMSSTRSSDPGSWHDVSCFVHEAEIFRGRERFTDRFQPAVASLTFDNRSGWADLVGSYSAVAAAPVRPGRQIRVGVRGPFDSGLVATRWLFYGFIDQATPAYDPVLQDVVTINCIDALGEAGQTTAPAGPLVGVNETVSTRINRVLDAVGWFDDKRLIAATPTTVQGTSLGTQAVDLLGVAADSAGGVVYGDLYGNVVFRDLNWELYDPDTPPDGEIGNGDPGGTPLPGSPPYVDPTPGPVYDPDPPIPTHPADIHFCVSGPPAEGTVVEQGDGWKIYIEGGHLWYESSGHLYDMGEWTSDNLCTTISDDGGTPERTDDGPGIPPLPGVEVPYPFAVEFLGYSDGNTSTDTVTVAGLHPGNDCLLVVLISAISDNALGTTTLTPFPSAGGSVTGGGLTFAEIDVREPSGGNGAESYGAATEIGRTDPGTFDLLVDWSIDNRSAQHIVTVWKVTHYRADMFQRMKLGAYLHAATWDRTETPFPSPNPPGKGSQHVDFHSADTDGTQIVPYSRTTDIAIAQSLAEEHTGPFGATFSTTEGEWWIPAFADAGPGLLDVGSFADDFERADGPLGADWTTPSASPTGASIIAPVIASGRAVNPTPSEDPGLLWAVAHPVDPVPGDHFIEAEIIPVEDNGVTIWAHFDPDTFSGISWGFRQQDATTGNLELYTWTDGVGFNTFIDPGVANPTTLRLESTPTGHYRAFADGTQLFEGDWADGGEFLAIGIEYNVGTTASPGIEWVDTGGGGIVRKCSWVAGYRPNAAAPDVRWTEVNTGVDDIQSTQAMVVMESGADIGFTWRVLAYHQSAPVTGDDTPAGSFSSTIRPERTSIVLVFVAAFADAEVLGDVTVTCPALTFTPVLTQPTDTIGWGQGSLWQARLDGFAIDPAAPPVVTVSWGVVVSKLEYVIYEVTNADSVGGTASAVRGTHVPGSLSIAGGGLSLTLSSTPAPESVVFGFLAVAETDSNEGGATAGTGAWVEELALPAVGVRAYLQVQSRTGVSGDGTVSWVAMDSTTPGSAQTSTDAVAVGVEIKPLTAYATWSSNDPLMIGGSRDAFGGPIYSAEGSDTDGIPIWTFDPAAF